MAEPLTLLNQKESTLLQNIASLSDDERNKYFDENPAVEDYYSNLVKKLEAPRTPVDYDPTTFQSSLQKAGKGLKGIADVAETSKDKLPNINLTPFLSTDFILDAYKNVGRPVGEWLDDEEKLQAAANIGIDVNTSGADFLTRLKAGFGNRQLSFEDSVKLLTKQLGKKPYYVEDIAGIGTVFQANEGDRLVAFNRPGADMGDIAEFLAEEAIPLTLDIGAQVALTGLFKNLPVGVVKNLTSGAITAGGSASATFAGELAKLLAGQQFFGLNQDADFVDLMKQSIEPAAFAGAGTGVFNSLAFIGRGFYRALKGEKMPNDAVNKMNDMLQNARKEAETTLKPNEVPGFNPTLGQKYKSQELLALEDAFINAPGTDPAVRRAYLQNIQDNEESLIKFATQLSTEFGEDFGEQAIEVFGRNFKAAAGENKNKILEEVRSNLKLNEKRLAAKIKEIPGYEGAASGLGIGLYRQLPDEGGTYLSNLVKENLEAQDALFETVKVGTAPYRATTTSTRNTLTNLLNQKKTNSIFTVLDDPSFAQRIFGDNANASQELLLKLSNRDAQGKFISPLNLGELYETRKLLNLIRGGKKEVDLDPKEITKLMKAVDEDISATLNQADLTGNKITVGDMELSPSEAWNFAKNQYTKANELARKQFISDLRKGRVLPSQLFDETMNKSVKNANVNEYFDDIFDVLELGDDSLITDLRFAFGERLKDKIRSQKPSTRQNAVNEFLAEHSGIFRRLYPTKKDQKIFRQAARDLDYIAKARASYDDAVSQINKEFEKFTGDTDDVISNVYDVFRGTPNESKLQLNSRRRKLARILKTSPELQNQFQFHLQKILLDDITTKDPFMGKIIDLDSLIKTINDPNFEQSYKIFFSPKYIDGLKKLAETTQFSNKRIMSEISKESAQNAKDIVRQITQPDSLGQRLFQFLLGPLNAMSVRFRLFDKTQAEKSYDLLTRLITDEQALESFIQNRYKSMNQIKTTSPIGGLIARNYDGILSDDEIPEEVKLLEE
tara:strand:- start:6505 stop:9537 length:3033 start_codon:yes stop_codon:yes gene_type:complete